MDFCSDMYEGLGFFGGYPSKEEFDELIRAKVTAFVDLTTDREKRNLPFVYTSSVPAGATYLNFPILDNHAPKNRKLFLDLVYHVAHRLRKREKVYIHCRGGHGRSGILVASLLCYLRNIQPYQAIQRTTLYHSRRPNLKLKWKDTTCPQMYRQQKFIMDLFQPVLVSYHDYHRFMEKDPQKLIQYIGLRPVCTDASTPVISELVYYIRQAVNHPGLSVKA
jgi:protein-tyrosine phosphatase